MCDSTIWSFSQYTWKTWKFCKFRSVLTLVGLDWGITSGGIIFDWEEWELSEEVISGDKVEWGEFISAGDGICVELCESESEWEDEAGWEGGNDCVLSKITSRSSTNGLSVENIYEDFWGFWVIGNMFS